MERIFLKICLQIEYLGEILDVEKKLRPDELGVMCGEVETKDTEEKYQSSE